MRACSLKRPRCHWSEVRTACDRPCCLTLRRDVVHLRAQFTCTSCIYLHDKRIDAFKFVRTGVVFSHHITFRLVISCLFHPIRFGVCKACDESFQSLQILSNKPIKSETATVLTVPNLNVHTRYILCSSNGVVEPDYRKKMKRIREVYMMLPRTEFFEHSCSIWKCRYIKTFGILL